MTYNIWSRLKNESKDFFIFAKTFNKSEIYAGRYETLLLGSQSFSIGDNLEFLANNRSISDIDKVIGMYPKRTSDGHEIYIRTEEFSPILRAEHNPFPIEKSKIKDLAKDYYLDATFVDGSRGWICDFVVSDQLYEGEEEVSVGVEFGDGSYEFTSSYNIKHILCIVQKEND